MERVISRCVFVCFLACCAYACGAARHVFDTMEAYGYAVDDAVNLYLVGRKKEGPGTDMYFAVTKIGRDGRKCWDRVYEAAEDGYGCAIAVVLDGQGNVWVAGRVDVARNTGKDSGLALVKYSADGKVLADSIYKKPGHGSRFYGMQVLGEEGICIGINSYELPRWSSLSFNLLLYDAAGKKVREDVAGASPMLACIGASNLCVGEFDTDKGPDCDQVFSIVEIDARGERSVLKAMRVEADQMGPWIIAGDRDGNFYIADDRDDSESEMATAVLCKFSRGGDALWTYVLGRRVPAAENEKASLHDLRVEVDEAGNVYVAEMFAEPIEHRRQESRGLSFAPQKVTGLRVCKLNRDGTRAWSYEHRTDANDLTYVGPFLLRVLKSGHVLCIFLVEGEGVKADLGCSKADLYGLYVGPDGKELGSGRMREPSDWGQIFADKQVMAVDRPKDVPVK